MERNELYVYAIAFIVLSVLLVIVVTDNITISSMNGQLGVYKKQQREFSQVVSSQYLEDMDTARQAWIVANTGENVELENQGISVEADTISTTDFTAVFDLRDPSMTRISSMPGDVGPGEVVVYLGQYYTDNMTRASSWITSYRVNTTTHEVSGLTPILIENIATEYYTDSLAPTIYRQLGVSNGTVTGYGQQLIDCSYIPESGSWLDVTEYKYSLRYTQLSPYLLIKTYVNATAQQVSSFDISKPYYDSVTGTSF